LRKYALLFKRDVDLNAQCSPGRGRSNQHDDIAVAREHRVGRQEAERLGQRLSNQKAVEGVVVAHSEFGDPDCVGSMDREFDESGGFDGRGQISRVCVDLSQVMRKPDSVVRRLAAARWSS